MSVLRQKTTQFFMRQKTTRFEIIKEDCRAIQTRRLCKKNMGVSACGLSVASRRQRSDLVIQAHIKKQSRFSLNSDGRPRMAEELKKISRNVGHGRASRLMRQTRH